MKSKIFLPHLFYKVEIYDIKKAKGRALEFLNKGYYACCARVNKNQSNIYIGLPVKKEHIPTLVHELTHVIQNICDDRGIIFELEKEHTAYIMQFMLNEILGFDFY